MDWKMISVLVTVFVTTLGVIGTLVGIIWSMHTRRVDETRKEVAENKKTNKDDLEKIYTGISEIKSEISKWQISAAKDFVTHAECQERRNECRHGKGK